MTATKRYKVKLKEYELCVMINILNEYRKAQLQERQPTEKLKALLLRLIDTLEDK